MKQHQWTELGAKKLPHPLCLKVAASPAVWNYVGQHRLDQSAVRQHFSGRLDYEIKNPVMQSQ